MKSNCHRSHETSKSFLIFSWNNINKLITIQAMKEVNNKFIMLHHCDMATRRISCDEMVIRNKQSFISVTCLYYFIHNRHSSAYKISHLGQQWVNDQVKCRSLFCGSFHLSSHRCLKMESVCSINKTSIFHI